MKHRDFYSKYENFRPQHQSKAQSTEADLKPAEIASPRISENSDSKMYKTIDLVKERLTIFSQKSHENLPMKTTSGFLRNSSVSRMRTQDKPPKVEDLIEENRTLREKLDILQKERDLIKMWKKPAARGEVKQYQDKLNFLVRKIQQFLSSSLKFQSMLREKLGHSVASLYEEERNLFKHHVVSAAQELEIPIKYSPISSPLRSSKSSKLEEYSSYENESSKIMEELKNERNKTKRLQIELNNELSKKDTEMKNIRDRLIELESIEKNKIENERKFAKASQEWQVEKKEFLKEIDYLKVDNKKYRDKLQDFDEVIVEIQQENMMIKEKYDEINQENSKLNDSLQTFDRLYNYTKKWVEKIVDENKISFESKIKEINTKLEKKELELNSLKDNFEKTIKKSKENNSMSQESLELKRKNAEMLEKIRSLEEKLKKTQENHEFIEKNSAKIVIDLQDTLRELKEKKVQVSALRAEKNFAEESIENLTIELEMAKSELEAKIQENAEICRKSKEFSLQIGLMNKEKEQIDKLLKEIQEKNEENKTLSNKISQNYLDLEKMQQEKKELLKKISGLNSENQELQGKAHEFIQENHNLQCELLKSEQETENLRINYEHLQDVVKKNEALQEEIEGKGKQIGVLQKFLKEKEDFFLVNTSKITELNRLLKEKEDFIRNIEGKLTGFEKMGKEIGEKVQYIGKITEDMKKKDQEIDNLREKIIENEEQYRELADKYAESMEKIDNFKQILANKDKNIKELKGQCENYKETLKQLDEKDKEISDLNVINQNNRILRENILKYEDEIKLLRLQNTDLVEKITKKDKEINKIKENLDESHQILKFKEKSIENFESSIKDQENLIKTLNTKENYIMKIEKRVEFLMKSVEEKDNMIASLKNIIENSETAYKDLETRLKELEELPNLIREKAKLQESLNNSMKNAGALEKLLKEKGDLLKIKDNQIKEIEPLRENNRELNDKINELVTENKGLINKIEKMTEEIKKKEKIVEELNSQNLNNLQFKDQILEKNEEIDELKARIVQEQKGSQSNTSLYENLLKEKGDEITRLNKSNEKLQERIRKISQSSSNETEILSDQVLTLTQELEDQKASLSSLKISNEKFTKLEQCYKDTISSLQKDVATYKADIENYLKQIASYKQEIAAKADNRENLSSKVDELKTELTELRDKNQELIAQYQESEVCDKEEISRLNSELMKLLQTNEAHKKEIQMLVQKSVTAENAVKSYHCENCEILKTKISELECAINSAEESLGGFFTNSLVESITNLVSSKTQNLRRAPRPPLQRGKHDPHKRQSEEIKVDVTDELLNKSPMITEGSKRSNSSAFSLPEYSDLRNELNEEKIEAEKYLTQIKLLKEDIRELERKLKRSQDVNDKINAEVLKSALLKMVRSMPIQNNEIEGMISLIFSIICVPKEELMKLEPERKAKFTKRFGVF